MGKIIELKTFTDQRGSLTVLEKELPFQPKRIYYIYNCNSESRGGHRHKKTTQVLICVAGQCDIYWTNGKAEETVTLDLPNKGLIVYPEDWHTMSGFSPNAILLVMASELFDPDDYVDEGYEE